MHTVKLNIDDSIFDKFMGLLDILPKDKVEVMSDKEYPSVSFEEAKLKVEKALNNIPNDDSILLDQAINKVLKS